MQYLRQELVKCSAPWKYADAPKWSPNLTLFSRWLKVVFLTISMLCLFESGMRLLLCIL